MSSNVLPETIILSLNYALRVRCVRMCNLMLDTQTDAQPRHVCRASEHLRRGLTRELSIMHPHTCHQSLDNSRLLVTLMQTTQMNSLNTVVKLPL
jgi:hypothetical protein